MQFFTLPSVFFLCVCVFGGGGGGDGKGVLVHSSCMRHLSTDLDFRLGGEGDGQPVVPLLVNYGSFYFPCPRRTDRYVFCCRYSHSF